MLSDTQLHHLVCACLAIGVPIISFLIIEMWWAILDRD